MAIRFPRVVWTDWNAAVRDLVNVLSSFLMDEAQPYRWEDVHPELMEGTGVTPSKAVFKAGIQGYQFLDATASELHFIAVLPHTYEEGSNIKPRVRWAPLSGNSTGVVQWNLEYTIGNRSGTFQAVQTITVEQTAEQAHKHQVAQFGDITGSAATIGAVIAGRLYRNGNATADTYTTAAAFLSLDFNCRMDTARGSWREDDKWGV